MLKDLNFENVGSTVENVALPTIGWAGSGALVALVPDKRKKIVKGALLGASILVAAATQAGAKVMKPGTKVLSGIAIRQGVDLLQDALRSKYAITDASSSSDKLIAGAVGLACPDGSCHAANAQYYDAVYSDTYNGSFPALNSPEHYDTVYQEDMMMEEASSSFA